ncbi:efflux ABC transporter, permease protein [[Clostridium] methylpentosum DSM 5476]|uniref:Efflux ABC transporter, permease protein n=1 Tax=[Clostridium] methylpentosum DSM 5476 TaxID=537013 RepID=C0EDB9_9FIRM|nr:efflux ABC transporter, permease protein [[Clostridium] methylpentosum DSM 5476]MDY3990031.1 FtsX-like permease family protein [Massilioclostridium sp.]
MEIKTLWRANSKRHKGSILGVFSLLILVSVSLATVLSVWSNSSRFVTDEMNRLGFGEMTAWVSGLSQPDELAEEITSLEDVERVGVQSLIYSEYEIGEQTSDSEGQLITYDPQVYPYQIFTDDLSGHQEGNAQIAPGEIYVSPSLSSMFGVQIGDAITFPIGRNGADKSFVVKGWFEDPFMGSSMIGMKSFLISEQDYNEIAEMISDSGHNALARTGYMLHILKAEDSALSTAQLNASLNQNTSLASFAEFTHSRAALSGFMLTLQNVFTGLLLAFVVILLLVSLVVLSHSIGSTIEQDYRDMGILKTMGFTVRKLRILQLLQYLTGILSGVAVGVLVSIPVSALVSHMTVTTTGLLIPTALPAGLCLVVFLMILCLLCGFIWLKTGKIKSIAPYQAIRGGAEQAAKEIGNTLPIRKRGLGFWLAMRQLLTGKKRYVSACLVAMLLVFFASLLGRINVWLGPNGEGLMEAFHPADLHMAVQPMGETGIEDVEQTIEQYTSIADQYMLGMPSVSVNGIDYTANVITDSQRFHLLQGRTCQNPNEVVLTEFVASDLGVRVGDTITVAASLGSAEYRVTGIYQCANDMGANIGMNREGYDQIGEESPTMWCTHYFLADPELQPQIMQALEDTYGGDVYLHENSWPGLYGILSAMQLMMIFLYGIVAVFVLIVTLLTAGKLLFAEQKDLGIYQALGFSSGQLRFSFALRFGLASLLGSVLGTALSAALTDPLVAFFMRMQGISNFSSQPGVESVLLPATAVVVLFSAFAWMAADRIKKVRLSALLTE